MTTKKKPERTIRTQGGDFVAGDQNKVSMGNVSGSTVVIGKNNVIQTNPQAGVTVNDLAKLVKELRDLLPQAKLDTDTQEVVEADIQVVEKQLAKPEPKKALVLPKLESVVKVLSSTAAAGEAITKLRPMLDQAVAWAQTLLK